MKRFVLAALTATALATPTLAQRTPPPPPAQVAPEIERLRDAALNDTIAWDIV